MNKKLIVIIMTAMLFLVISSTDIFISSLPEITKIFNVSADFSSMMISAFTLGLAVFSLIVGVLSERFGRRKTVLWGLAIYTISSLGIFISPSLTLIIFFRLLQAFGASFIAINSRLIIKDILTVKEQVNATGTLMLGIIVSPAIAPSIGALLAKYLSWRACFSFSAVLGMVLFALTYYYIKETNPKLDEKLPGIIEYTKSYLHLFSDSLLTPSLIVIGAVSAGYYSFIAISSFLYINVLGLSPSEYSYLFMLIAGGYFIGNHFMRRLNNRGKNLIYITRIGIIYTVIGTLFLLFTYLFNSSLYILIILTVGVVFLRMSIALINSPLNILLLNHFRKKGGQAIGITYFAMLFGGTVGTSTVTLFISTPIFSLQMSCILFLALSVIGFLMLIKAAGRITRRSTISNVCTA